MGVVSRLNSVGNWQVIKESQHGSFVIPNDLGYLYGHGLPKFHAASPQKEISSLKTAKPFPNFAGWPHGLPDPTSGDELDTRSQLKEEWLDLCYVKKERLNPRGALQLLSTRQPATKSPVPISSTTGISEKKIKNTGN